MNNFKFGEISEISVDVNKKIPNAQIINENLVKNTMNRT